MSESLGDLVTAAIALQRRHAAQAGPVAQDFIRRAHAEDDAAEAARWTTILEAVHALEQP